MTAKSLSKISWNVTEQEYRKDSSLSYSTLARYEKTGFSGIANLYDDVSSDAITFGSMVDCLITEGEERFNEKFAVFNAPPSESIEKIITYLAKVKTEKYLSDISDDDIVAVCNILGYQLRWKNETRVEKIRSEGTDYYTELKENLDKTIVDRVTYNLVMTVVDKLKTHSYIGKYLSCYQDNTEVLFQTKFKTTLQNINVKCMFDILLVDHKSKKIIPVDLKTTSVKEYEFAKKYLENRYDIQSRLYYAILKQIISEDDYFKDFTLCPFRFIVINGHNCQPLVFVDENSIKLDEIVLRFKSGRITTLRNPIEIATELSKYLSTNAEFPEGINNNKVNSLTTQLNKL